MFYSVSLFAQNAPKVQLKTTSAIFEAGSPITLKFNLKTEASVHLFCHSSYGSSLILPSSHLEKGHFSLPNHLTSKKGILDFQLISPNKILYKGSISIIANTKSTTLMESYIGPPSISAGTNDYTMLVAVPTDSLDNPIANNTPVAINHQFLETQKNISVHTKDFIAWKRIYSYKASGRILVSSKVHNTTSKEFSIEVFPAQPTHFTLNYKRKHAYADGNQVTTFVTSIIKDRYGNVISDGTLIDFSITNTKGRVLKTQGISINGIATAKMLHPDHKETWSITSYVSGMATSNTITINYTSVTKNLPIAFAEKNRQITIGPLRSFMGQLIPDGAVVKLTIFKNRKKIETKLKTTSKGITVFQLEEGFYPTNIYSFTIEALGLKTEYLNLKL